MYSKFVLAIRFCSAKMAIMVGKWPIADCYFKLCRVIISQPIRDVPILLLFSPIFFLAILPTYYAQNFAHLKHSFT